MKKRNQTKEKRLAVKSFTLIELLVVIAIIAITTNNSISVNAVLFD